MFPSSNSYNPFPLTTHAMPGSSFTGGKHPAAASSLEDPPPPFWHFPTPFIDDDDDRDGLLMSHLLSPQQQQQQQQILGTSSSMVPPDSEVNAASPIEETKTVTTNRKRSSSSGAKQGIPRKRAGKKDRHSKIYTAHGPRDRRMRLSLQIARKFFDLQDMLGFDKASKTIEWLFSKSKAAIKELTENFPGVKHSCSGGGKSVSSTSESEVVSATKECEDNMGDQKGVIIARAESMRSTATATARETKERKSRKISFNPAARESRDKARARARERTREKMKMKGLEKSNMCSDESNPNELERLRSSSPHETGENSGPSTQTNSCLKVVAEEEQHHQSTVHILEHQMDSVSIIEKFLGINTAARSSSMFNYSHNIADSSGENSEENCPVFSGNWGLSNERIQYSYCAMTNIKESTGNAQEKNPSIIFMTDPNEQEQKCSPIFMSQGENPSSNLMVNSYAKIMNHNSELMTPSNVAQDGRSYTSILMSTSDIGLHSHYQENPSVASKHHNFY